MNKLAVVVTVAAVATLAGCKDPDYLKPHQAMSTDEVKQVEAVPETPAVATAPEAEAVAPVETTTVEVVEEPKCQCPAGTVHQAPCKCGAADCKCKVAEPEPETTEYIVQRGDTLSAISKRYNIKIASIMAVNPKMTSDKILIGQRIKLPGKVEVGEQKVPAPAPKAASKTAAKDAAVEPYTGAVEPYTVKEGDTIGKIAYGHGINIRQLKAMNGLKSNMVRIGQKLKVPAGQAAPKAETPKTEPAEAAPAPVETAPAEPAVEEAAPVEAPVEEAVAAPVEPPAPAEATMDYTVQEGDDITGISIQYGVAAAKIRELNGLDEMDQLKPGQVIKLPADIQ